jgi:hypothetical protein
VRERIAQRHERLDVLIRPTTSSWAGQMQQRQDSIESLEDGQSPSASSDVHPKPSGLGGDARSREGLKRLGIQPAEPVIASAAARTSVELGGVRE